MPFKIHPQGHTSFRPDLLEATPPIGHTPSRPHPSPYNLTKLPTDLNF